MGASLAGSIGLQMLLPFPYGLGLALAVFIVLPLFLRKKFMGVRGYGDSRGGGGGLGGFFGLGQSGPARASVKYVCLVCNHRHKGSSCPRCGSKMKRADF